MDFEIKKLAPKDFPELLKEIPDPPKQLFLRGKLPDKDTIFLCVIGSRKYSNYGREVCQKLISGLAGENVVIVSGLAIGLDSIAHRQAIDSGLKTIAVPGSGLNPEIIYPASNFNLAQDILKNGGALLSEFEPNFKATVWSFPQRNRIMAGLSNATLVIEATKKSGTLITSRLAMDYNRDVLTVPGSIFSENSTGPNELIKHGATPITSSEELKDALGLLKEDAPQQAKLIPDNLSPNEKNVLEILSEPTPRDEIIQKLSIPISESNMLLSAMEIKGLISESMGEIYKNF